MVTGENNKPLANIAEQYKQGNSATALVNALDELSNRLNKTDDITNKIGLKDSKETISDDFDLDDSALHKIREQEELVRELLTMFNVNYDELVRMDGKSVYSQAVVSNPQVLEVVKTSPNPVLEAVKIAFNYKPYAEFISKYGNDPEAIKKAIRAEVESEQNVDNKKLSDKNLENAKASVPFSSNYSVSKNLKEQNGGHKELADIFGK